MSLFWQGEAGGDAIALHASWARLAEFLALEPPPRLRPTHLVGAEHQPVPEAGLHQPAQVLVELRAGDDFVGHGSSSVGLLQGYRMCVPTTSAGPAEWQGPRVVHGANRSRGC